MEYRASRAEGTLTSVYTRPKTSKEPSIIQMVSNSIVSRLYKLLVVMATICSVCFAVIKRLCMFVVRKTQKKINAITCYQPVKYYSVPLSPHTDRRLGMVNRKVLVLDLDETLIHSQNDSSQLANLPTALADFTLKVRIEDSMAKFHVFKRPHVDYFLSTVSQWYDLVVFTASLEVYGSSVIKRLDRGRNLFKGCLFRQHCTMDMYGYTKDLTLILKDLSDIFILDNSPGAYRQNPDNAIPIKSYMYDPHDTALLDLLPALDALRFTQDVRSILSRNLHLHSL